MHIVISVTKLGVTVLHTQTLVLQSIIPTVKTEEQNILYITYRHTLSTILVWNRRTFNRN